MNAITIDERHAIGGNHPPEEIAPETPVEISPFDAHKANIEDLFLEAKNWIDGTAIENQAQADAVQELLRKTQEAHDAADKSRVEEKKPWDDGANAVQTKYAPLIADTKAVKGKTTLAVPALKGALSKWLTKCAEEQEAEAKRVRDAADAAAEAARALVEEARETGDLAVVEEAEEALQDAKSLDRAATRVETAKPMARGYGRAVGLRDNWVIKGFEPVGDLDGETILLRHYWEANKPGLVAAALELARQDIQQGKRQIPGLIIANERRV